MIEFQKMTDKEFENYFERTVNNYAKEKIKAGNWDKDSAIEKAEKSVDQLLPNGVETENNYLYSIYNNDKHLGYIWYKIDGENKRVAFLCDIIIFKKYRNRGFGKKTMKLFERKVKELGCEKIQLHVFAHNKPAVSLYKKLDFKFTNYRMEKDISS